MKKIIICAIALLTCMPIYAQNNKQYARKIAEANGACTLPDGSMGKMTVTERTVTKSSSSSNNYQSSSTSSSGSSVNASSSLGTSTYIQSGIGNTNTNSKSSSKSNSSTNGNVITEKTECRPIPKW